METKNYTFRVSKLTPTAPIVGYKVVRRTDKSVVYLKRTGGVAREIRELRESDLLIHFDDMLQAVDYASALCSRMLEEAEKQAAECKERLSELSSKRAEIVQKLAATVE